MSYKASHHPLYLIFTVDLEVGYKAGHSLATLEAEVGLLLPVLERYKLPTTWFVQRETKVNLLTQWQEGLRPLIQRGDCFGFHSHELDVMPAERAAEVAQQLREAQAEARALDTEMRVIRAGKAFYLDYFTPILAEQGFLADLSAVPNNWPRPSLLRRWNTLFTGWYGASHTPYEMDAADKTRPGSSGLLEFPLAAHLGGAHFIANFYTGEGTMRQLFDSYHRRTREGAVFFVTLIHPWELRPGGRPDRAKVEKIDRFLEYALSRPGVQPITAAQAPSLWRDAPARWEYRIDPPMWKIYVLTLRHKLLPFLMVRLKRR